MANEKNVKLTEEEARTAILNYRDQSKKSQTDIARELDVSSSQLSQFLGGTYPTPHTIISKIEQLLKISEKRAVSPKEPSFKLTTVSQKVIDLITYCHVQSKIGVAYGDAGIGKTMAVRQYCKENQDAVMITVSPSYASITGINELIAEKLKIREKTARKIEAEAVEKLQGSNRVIIIDEAQHLTVRVINHLRCIADKSFVEGTGGVGIAFIGNEEIYLKMKGAGQAAYAQLFSRIGNRKHLLTSNIQEKDIRLVFEEASLSDEATDILFRISRTNYGLRGAVNVFVNTIIGFQIEDYAEISAHKLSRMAKEMNIC